ncbi:hypothetical protein SKAU_G00089890 [Synaphobranchus kaupii]|uniref:YqaJ viral recombinase domain-containing protein n=1 Tax=Synaphobranchus kaupii TaxID=118154 RepID=A0A9Q1FXD0_SYNKA|nr:hypothetical protein SKAU_G00089890 [Synaphobranchus kaupii]
MAAIRTVEYAEGSQIAFTKAQRKRSADGCACRTDPDKPAVSLLKKLCYPVAYKDPNNNTPHSLRWGTEHEDKVVEEYTKVMESQHSNLTVRKGGLVINPHYPWLGASPDGILICDCHEMGVLEVEQAQLLALRTN